MSDPAHIVAIVLLLAMITYVASGGADFGGIVLELFARGPRRREQVAALRAAIAPIWEANHVWLILVVVLLFVCFPAVFAALMVALHVPITVLLVGIVLRGAAFVFQSHAAGDRDVERQSVRLSRAASAVAPFTLGVIAGAAASGHIRVDPVAGVAAAGWVWLQPFPLLVGLMTLVLCTFLAAVYMTVETTGALREDFRRRALAAGLALGVVALPTALVALATAPVLGDPLLRSAWSLPFHAATGAVAAGALVALARRRYRLARLLAIGQAAMVLVGWALAQYPHLLAPDLDIASCAAPRNVLVATLLVLAAGTVLLVPAFVWLFVVFKAK